MSCKIKIIRTLCMVALAVTVAGAAGAQSFVYLPSGDPTDGRFLNLNSTGLVSFGGATLGVAIGVPAGRSTFELGVFDGDNGKNDAGAVSPSAGNWDLGNSEMEYCLYVDPATPGVVDAGELIGCWHANTMAPTPGPLWGVVSPVSSSPTMVNDDWWSLSLSTGPEARSATGNFFYFLVIREMGTAPLNSANFKLRSEGELQIIPSAWSIEASLRQPFNDAPIVYPAWDGVTIPGPGDDFWLTTPTTYDGTYSFTLNVPSDLVSLTVWDGDGDLGTGSTVGLPSGLPFPACDDTDDPNTSNAPFLPFWATAGTLTEGDKGPGAPLENNLADIFRRTDCLSYRLVDPLGNVYVNSDPSGNQEWERFVISADPTVDADVYVAGDELPEGAWQLEIAGLDLNNFLALRTLVDVCTGDCDLVRAGAGTPGYWKNHPEAWPFDEIVVAGVTYTVDEAIAAMNTKGGDKTIVVFNHYVAAFLNVAIGAEDACILDTVAATEAWLVDNPLGSGVKGNASAWDDGEPLKDRLDAYNNGHLCAPSRDQL